MALNLFYITNRPDVALVAEKNGVDRIWIDLETLGKEARQKGMNTVKSLHTVEDIRRIRPLLTTAELLVRIDPWHDGSAAQIDRVVEAGADIIMLPMWKSADEVRRFLEAVNGRAKTTLLLETAEALACVDEVLALDFDEIHIGLNDLHLSLQMDFMFQLLADGTVEKLCGKFRKRGLPYGFGGIARLGMGDLPAERVIAEHYRLGSTRAILSRSFCNTDQTPDIADIERVFRENMAALRQYEQKCAAMTAAESEENRQAVVQAVAEIVRKKREVAKG